MKQKIVDFPDDGKYPYPNPSNTYSMMFSLERFDDAGWLSDDSLPKIVEHMVNTIQKGWNTDIPYGFYDNFGHSTIGYCNFLSKKESLDALKLGDKEFVSFPNLDYKVLLARISFGPESRQTLWDMTSFDRLHISAYARRIINPLDSKDNGLNSLVDESIYFSMRWINDEFLDHTSAISDPLQEMDFDELRSTYFLSREINLQEHRMPLDDWHSRELFEQFMDRYQKSHISKNISLNYDDRLLQMPTPQDYKNMQAKFSAWKNRGTFKFYKDVMPEIGYEHVLGILSKHGHVKPGDFEGIKQMDHILGVEYFLDRIIPAMKNFVDCKYA